MHFDAFFFAPPPPKDTHTSGYTHVQRNLLKQATYPTIKPLYKSHMAMSQTIHTCTFFYINHLTTLFWWAKWASLLSGQRICLYVHVHTPKFYCAYSKVCHNYIEYHGKAFLRLTVSHSLVTYIVRRWSLFTTVVEIYKEPDWSWNIIVLVASYNLKRTPMTLHEKTRF